MQGRAGLRMGGVLGDWRGWELGWGLGTGGWGLGLGLGAEEVGCVSSSL